MQTPSGVLELFSEMERKQVKKTTDSSITVSIRVCGGRPGDQTVRCDFSVRLFLLCGAFISF